MRPLTFRFTTKLNCADGTDREFTMTATYAEAQAGDFWNPPVQSETEVHDDGGSDDHGVSYETIVDAANAALLSRDYTEVA
jgi:hypothetical protein